MSELDFILSQALNSQLAKIKRAWPSLRCHRGPEGTAVPPLSAEVSPGSTKEHQGSSRGAVRDTAPAPGLEGSREWDGVSPSTACAVSLELGCFSSWKWISMP